MTMQHIHPYNYDLRLAFLKDCQASGMAPQKVAQRQATTIHLVRLAGNRPLNHFTIGEFNDLLAGATRLDSSGVPLSHERKRKLFNHTSEFLRFSQIEYPKDFQQLKPHHLKNLRVASPVGIQPTPEELGIFTVDDVRRLIEVHDRHDLRMQRAKAAACLQFLSGMRIGAVASLPLRALSLAQLRVHQHTNLGVRTKNQKSATTFLLNLPDLIAPVQRWADFLAQSVMPEAMFYNVFTATDPPVPTNALPGKNRGLALADDYRRLCQLAGVPYCGSHGFRRGHIIFVARRCKTPTEFAALSQNVMHADERMTRHYAALSADEVGHQYQNLFVSEANTGSIEDTVKSLSGVVSDGVVQPSQRMLLKRLAREIIDVL